MTNTEFLRAIEQAKHDIAQASSETDKQEGYQRLARLQNEYASPSRCIAEAAKKLAGMGGVRTGGIGVY